MASYYISHTQFPCCQYISIIHLSQLINQYHYVSIHSTPYLVQISFILCILPFSSFCYRIQSRVHSAFSYHVFLVSSGLKSFSGFSCFLSCFDSFEEYWSCTLENVALGCIVFSFRLRLRVCGKTIEVTCISCHIKNACYQYAPSLSLIMLTLVI